ncbi:helix-turn-helix domain-containing protein [Nonomuraea sp. NPDC049158]|uniref:helix-turn-helix domain-containing protein n=1 Tax=Nonomuraea sp. NPDC049158 TaxID=3155649 RepID=UPI0033C87B70
MPGPLDLVEEGLLWHMVDFADYAVTDSTMLWVRPGQVQRFGDLSAATGTLVLFQPDFLDPATAADVRLDDPFGRTLWQITGEDAPALRRALDHLDHEYGATRMPAATRSAILQRLLGVLLSSTTRRSMNAKRLLAHGDQPVAGIGTRLGFLDTSNFVKYFVQRTGTTPATFRGRYRSARA